jgi:RimJ/RimL family protein N-acetyltransferase
MSADLQPTLAGALVRLRPLRADDHDALLAVASDPAIWAQHPAHDRWRPAVFRAYFDANLASGGGLVVHDAVTGALVGATRFNGYDAARREVEIGWTFLARSHWGGAHNAEMKRLLLDHAFGFVDTVFFMIGPDNVRSRKAVEKLGAVLVGETVNADGRPSVRYDLAKAVHEARRR